MYEAIEKINNEMQKEPDNEYLEIIGQYIIDRCTDEDVSAKVMQEGKSLRGAFDAVKAAAKSKAKNGCGIVRDNEVFDAVDKYFEIVKDDAARRSAKASVDGEDTPEPQNSAEINIDFDNLLM